MEKNSIGKVFLGEKYHEAELFSCSEKEPYRHWLEVNGKDFDGHRTLWSFSYNPYNYLKESELSGDEYRKGGSIKIFKDGVCVMSEFCREPDRAVARLHNLLAMCMDAMWEYATIGRKLYYRDHPCVIKDVLEDGELILATENGEDFPLWAFQKEDEEEARDREWTDTTRVHITDKNIHWWRKEPSPKDSH